jgi:GH24 family phage-related lysozyme (muramidase)
MKLSNRGTELIGNFEGFVDHPYNDPSPGRHCTIGFGHLIHHGPCGPGDHRTWGTISRERGLQLLGQDAQSREAAVEQLVQVPLNQNEFDALVSLVYNIGAGAFADSTVLRELNAGRRGKAAQAFMMWVKSGGVTLPGLVRRREAEMRLFLTGVRKPVRYSDEERRHLQVITAAGGVTPAERLRARDWLRAQAVKIQARARREPGGWGEVDRARRFRGIRRTLREVFGADMR